MAGMGIPAFFTPAGYGTEIAIGKEVREFNGKKYLMEFALPADFAIVKAWKGDEMGNLVFRKTTRNFSASMAKAGNVTIAEVEHLVRAGEIDPDHVHVPVFTFTESFKVRITRTELNGKLYRLLEVYSTGAINSEPRKTRVSSCCHFQFIIPISTPPF